MRVHSYLSPKCRVGKSPISGSGVFAGESFAPGELVAVWGGKVYTEEECHKLGAVFPHCRTHPILLYRGFYLGSENLFEFDDAELFNHSCEPNVGIHGQVVLVARKAINEGDELTFDYETLDDAPIELNCLCGAESCRGHIDGQAWRRLEFRRRHQGFLSWYLEDLIRREELEHSDEAKAHRFESMPIAIHEQAPSV